MISVVIPLFNKAKSVKQTVDSILNQTYKNFEIIIVNDGSTDNSLEILSEYTDKRIKILTQFNKGVSASRNYGIINSNFNLIALIDADDLWESHFLEEMNKLTIDFPEASLYGCACKYICDNQNKITNFGITDNFRGYLENYFEIAIDNTLFNSSSVILKKNEFLELGCFDESLFKGEDIDMWIKFALNKKLAYINKPLSSYILDADNRVTNKKTERTKSLIWNLKRYSNYEKKNPQFKKFLDGWRLANISNYLNGKRIEVDNIILLLKEINLNDYSLFYKILYYLPSSLHTHFYRIWITLKKVKKK